MQESTAFFHCMLCLGCRQSCVVDMPVCLLSDVQLLLNPAC